MDIQNIKTLGQLKAAGYQSKSIKEELRQNLIVALRADENPFRGIIGYENSVIPDLERAILSMHNINLLGLRGQAKTRLARLMVNLLDEYVPVVDGTELNDDPLQPLSRYARDLIAEKGDDTPIHWWHRSERYGEKLATPDVSIADLIGDVDPIKAANLKLPYSDERTLHFGIIPRSHRGIFVINELPDLQARIQVALFNILQEGDIQIRGFKLRLPLDIQFVFTANPEDYTNRGSIVTPLKDRIGSQILTHYPESIQVAREITRQEVRLSEDQAGRVQMVEAAENLLEQIGFEARESEYIDEKSGVSARLSISAFENLISAAERRALLNGEEQTTVRFIDFVGVIPAVTGKVELVYEGEQEGAYIVAENLIGSALRTLHPGYFPKLDKLSREDDQNPYTTIVNWFGEGHSVDLLDADNDAEFHKQLDDVRGLGALVDKYQPRASKEERYFFMEMVLHSLAEFSKLNKDRLDRGFNFSDLFSSMLG